MFEYKTKQFAVENGVDWISDWLNSLYKGGYGVKVVGYVCAGSSSIVVTVLRWSLSESKKEESSVRTFPARTTIDEIPEEPTINYPEGDFPNEDSI